MLERSLLLAGESEHPELLRLQAYIDTLAKATRESLADHLSPFERTKSLDDQVEILKEDDPEEAEGIRSAYLALAREKVDVFEEALQVQPDDPLFVIMEIDMDLLRLWVPDHVSPQWANFTRRWDEATGIRHY